MQRVTASHIVVLLHGIRTHAEWQKLLSRELVLGGLAPYPISYGFLNLVRFLWPSSRRKVYEWFQKEILSLKPRLIEGDRVSIVAHSFGTLIVGRSIADPDLPEFPVSLDRVIFCGAILPSDRDTAEAITKRCQSLLNDFSKRDIWARASRWVVSEAGDAGFRGFQTDQTKLLQKQHQNIGHSAYFTDHNFQGRWVPFLSGTQLTDTTYKPASAWITSTRNFRPWVTLIVVMSVVGLLLWRVAPVVLPHVPLIQYTCASIATAGTPYCKYLQSRIISSKLKQFSLTSLELVEQEAVHGECTTEKDRTPDAVVRITGEIPDYNPPAGKRLWQTVGLRVKSASPYWDISRVGLEFPDTGKRIWSSTQYDDRNFVYAREVAVGRGAPKFRAFICGYRTQEQDSPQASFLGSLFFPEVVDYVEEISQ
jgi:hypothetical protein